MILTTLELLFIALCTELLETINIELTGRTSCFIQVTYTDKTVI
jgi:hypothetical protein